jgi:hypothetical protein
MDLLPRSSYSLGFSSCCCQVSRAQGTSSVFPHTSKSGPAQLCDWKHDRRPHIDGGICMRVSPTPIFHPFHPTFPVMCPGSVYYRCPQRDDVRRFIRHEGTRRTWMQSLRERPTISRRECLQNLSQGSDTILARGDNRANCSFVVNIFLVKCATLLSP